MPFNTLQRQASWPPTRVLLHASHIEEITDEDLDSNPFSYFLTRPEDVPDQDMADIDLSAGIDEPTKDNNKTSIIREVSPSSLQRSKLNDTAIYDEDNDDDESYIRDVTIPITRKEYHFPQDIPKLRHTSANRMRHPEPATRGRGILKLPSGRGRGRTRSLSSGKPHAWREPSPDVWSIPEEDENEHENETERRRSEMERTPGLSDDDEGDEKRAFWKGKGKGKKRVRWAL